MAGGGPRHTGPWTVAEVLALPEDRTIRHELVGALLVVSPAPGVPHQRASYRLHAALEEAAATAGADVQVLEGVNVRLPSGLVVPDLVVADGAAPDAVALDAEAVQLVVELVSPGLVPPESCTMDRKVKPLLYAEAGIPSYWRMEFVPVPRLVVAELADGRYRERLTALGGAVTTVGEPYPVALDPAALVARGR